MKKLTYLLTCLSLPLACLFILLSTLAQAKDAPLTLAAEAALLTPKSSTALNPASALRQSDVAGEVLSATVSPDLVEAGTTLTFGVKIRNHGSISWGPNSVYANIHIYDSEGKLQTTIIASYVSPPMPVAFNGEAILFGYFSVPTSWSGTYNYAVELFAQERSLGDASGFTFAVSSISAETTETLDELPGLYGLTSAASGGSLDLVIAIDSTGSMCGTINTAKANAQDIAERIRSSIPDSRFALIDFRDFADGSPWPTIIRQNLTSDVLSFKSAVNEMVCGGGGDWPEAYIDVVYTAVDNISWRQNVTRILLIMGDAPPHDANYGTNTGDVDPYGRTWAGAANEALSRGVKVAMIAVGGGVGDPTVEQSYQDMANITGGLYRSAPDNAALAQDIIALVEAIAPNPLRESPPTVAQSQFVRNALLRIPGEEARDDEVFYGVNLPQDASEFERALVTNYQFGGIIAIAIPIDRYYGETTDPNEPSPLKNDVIGKAVPERVDLTIVAYDVESLSGFGRLLYPDRPRSDDVLYVNGHQVGLLEGRNEGWVEDTVSIPTEYLNFPVFDGDTRIDAPNTITIAVDTLSQGWATEVAWARLKIPGVRPILLVRGFNWDKYKQINPGDETQTWDTWKAWINTGEGWWIDGDGNLVDYPLGYLYSDIRAPNVLHDDETPAQSKSDGSDARVPVDGIKPLVEDGEIIRNAVHHLLDKYGVNKVNIVGHSKGGLDTRTALQLGIGQNVDTVVTLGTPHEGVPSVIIVDIIDTAGSALVKGTARELSSINIQRLKTADFKDPPGVRFVAVAGTDCHGMALGLGCWLKPIIGENDGLITVPSAHNGYATKYSLHYNHTGVRLERDTFDIVAPYLKPVELGGIWHAASVAQVTAPIAQAPESSASSTTGRLQVATILTGSISSGEIQTRTLALEGDSAYLILRWGYADDMSLILTDPSTQQVDPGNPPPNITYTASITDKTITYLIDSPQSGFWAAEITVTNPYTDGEKYWLTSMVSSTILMKASVDKDLYQPGDPILVQAAISDTNIPISSAIVTAAANLATLHLFDDGSHNDGTANDGLYANVFTDTNQSGHYLFRVEASGTSGSTPFTRLAYIQAEVASREAAFLNQYEETVVDENADHLYDTLVITTGVQLTSTGRYQIVGTLTTLTDTAIANATAILSDTAGLYQVPLSFDGTLIAQSGLDGPYQLSDLYLLDISTGTDVQADYRDIAYTTTAYAASQFQQDLVAVGSPITDEGVDTNGNGKYDLLRVQVPMSILNTGVYMVSVNLADSDGNGLMGFTHAYTLTDGVNILPLDFHGPSISLFQTDGPYNVNGFIISRSPTETLEIPHLYTTGVYSYTDFESDTLPPTSAIDPLPAVITSTPVINVSWTGDDPEPSAGIFYYDVQYKVGSDGTWTDWLTRTLLNLARFGPSDPITVTSGETYYFQMRATDYAGNQETYPGGDGDAHTTMLGVDLQVDKSTSTDFIQENTADYSINYRNDGPVAANNVVLTDTLPSGLSYVADTSGVTPTVSINTVVWPLGTVPPYANRSFNLTTYVSPTLVGGSLITNTLDISTADQESDYTNNSAVVSTTVQAPTKDMYVSKELDAGNATPGSNLTYEIYYRNYGTGSAADVVITDTLPVSTTYLSFSGPYTPTVLDNQVIWDLGTVPGSGSSGDRGSVYVTVHLSETVPVGTVLTNTVEIATSDTETNYANNVDTDVQTVSAGASDLQLYKYFESNFASPGSEVVYRLNYRNDNYDAAVGVTITDTLPMTVSYVSSTGAPEPNVVGDQVIWHLPSVPGKYQSGYEGNIYLTVYISDSVPLGTVLTNTAIITANNDTNPTNNSASDVCSVVTGVVQVSTGTDNDYNPALAMTASGELVSVWERNGELWTARSIDSGATWSVATQLAGCCRYQPALLRMADNSLWLVYRQNNDIWYRTSSDDGLNWSPEVQLTTHPADDWNPDLAQTTDGRIWVVWESGRSSGSNIWYKTTSDNGLSWTPDTEFPVDSGWNGNPTMAQAPDGTLWVMWFRGYGLAYSTSTDGGNTWSPLDFLDAGGPIHGPSLRRATDGTLWLAYPVTRYEAGWWRTNLYYQTSADSGGTWSGPRQFTFFVGENTELAIASMNDGRMGLAWRSDRTSVSKVWFGIPGLREDIDPPPYVSSIEHAPSPNPDSDDTITFRAWAQDETGVASVDLVWSLDSVAQPDLPMYDDGTHGDDMAEDGIYTAQHAPLPAGSQVTYRARATDTDANTFLYPGENSFQVLEPFIKTADILFVPDYGGNDTDWFQPYFTNALDELGYSYDIWDTEVWGEIDSATLNQYTGGTVVWAVPDWGYVTDGSSSSQANLQSYLDNGGKLFISGQDIGYYSGGSTFFSDYLHATFVQDDTDLYGLNGVSGDSTSDGLYLAISGGDGANNQDYPSEIDPIAPAVSIFTYDPSATTALGEPHLTEEVRAYPELGLEGHYLERAWKPKKPRESARLQGIVSSGTGAIRVDTGTYKVVYFAFGFEGINSASYRAAVMERVLAWLRGAPPRPSQLSPGNGSAVAAGDVTFIWSSVVGASSYQIQIDTTTAFTSPALISDTVTSTSYTATLTLGTWYWQVRALPDGSWTAVWELRVTEPLIRVTTDLADDWRPAVARTSDGELWVVWDSWRSDNNIWYETSDDNGATWSADTQLTTDPSSDYDPAIMLAGDGTIWVVWYSWRSGNADIWYKISTDGGATWSPATQLTTDPSSDYSPAIMQASDGTIWVVWYSYRSGNADVWYKTTSDGGATWSSAVQLTVAPEGDYRPAIAQTSDGTVWVLWDSWRTDYPSIWYKTSTDSGASWSPDAEFSTDTNWDYAPTIAQTSDGTIWVARMSESWDLWNFDIWYRTSNDGGVSWSADQQFTQFTGDDLEPGLAALPGNQVALAWSSDRAVNYDIWFGIIGVHGDINPPPHLDFIQNYPWPNPDSNDIVTILALVSDETGVLNVTLKWSEDGTPQPDLMMYDDGAHDDYGANDGCYGVQIGPFPAGTIVEYQVEITDVDGNTILAPQYPMQFESLEPFVKTADILFVPDYGGYDTGWFRTYYEDALGMQGYQYDVWDTGLRGAPDSTTLNLYTDSVVIWAVPYWGYFDDWDVQPTIEAYLDAGGKVFVTGQNVAQNLDGTTLMSDYLHASYVQGNTNLYVLNGTAGDPIGDGLALAISGGDGANNQYDTDEIDPVSPAVTVFTYDTTALAALAEPVRPEVAWTEREGGKPGAISIPAPWGKSREPQEQLTEAEPAVGLQGIISSGTAGLRVDTGTYKVVYFAFGFEAINSAGDRQLVMERVLDWTWSLPGDLDFNCVVNVADIMKVASRWRMTDTDPDWNPRYDLNGDGIITVVDIMLVVKHWGETCG